MPYKIIKRKCKKSNGNFGKYVLKYADKNKKIHSNCHTSKENAKSQISAIEIQKEEVLKKSIKNILFEESYYELSDDEKLKEVLNKLNYVKTDEDLQYFIRLMIKEDLIYDIARSNREVFGIGDKYVLKVAGKFVMSRNQNEREANPELIKLWGNFLPKLYNFIKLEDGTSLIISEMVNPIDPSEEGTWLGKVGLEQLGITSLFDLQGILDILGAISKITWDKKRGRVYIETSTGETYPIAYSANPLEEPWDEFYFGKQNKMGVIRLFIANRFSDLLFDEQSQIDDFIKKLLSNKFFNTAIKNYKKFGGRFGFRELRSENLGIANDGRPVILDMGY